jgi:L,D-transpeptidase ErfK/SrfK
MKWLIPSYLPLKSAMNTLRLISVVSIIFAVQTAWASTRQDAVTALSRLRQSGFAQIMPDEIKSVDDTFTLAERHYQLNEHDMAERYYLLTIQKIRVLEVSLADLRLTKSPENQQPEQNVLPSLQTPPLPQPSVTETTNRMAAPNQQEPSQNILTAPTPPPQVAAAVTAPLTSSKDFISEKLVGTASTYTVAKGDTFRLVAAKLGVSRQHLLKMNNLDAKAYLRVGQKLKYNNRKIIPQRIKEGIIVNIPDRTLYYFKRGKLVTALPVALGTGKKTEKFDWQTPTGKFKITAKHKDPTWHVPPSIQSEMEEDGKEVVSSIPPGPDNPLGRYAIMTSIPGILIHSTIKPWSIYSFASHGCIRVSPLQMEDFFNEVRVNTPGEIIYKPVKLAVTEQGRIFLEVHQNIYGKTVKLDAEARDLIKKLQISERVDWEKMETVVRQKSGIAEDITL